MRPRGSLTHRAAAEASRQYQCVDPSATASCRSATYLTILAPSHLRGVAPLPKEELLALKRSIAELAAIGRHLNQIARVLNQQGCWTGGARKSRRCLERQKGCGTTSRRCS